MDNKWFICLGIIAIYFVGLWAYPKIKFLFSRHKSFSGMRLPFNGCWYVAVGGRLFPNHHIAMTAQQFAYDFCIAKDDSGVTYRNSGKELSDYLCYNEPILAAHSGTVALVVDGIPDSPIGQMNPQMVYGNTVMIAHKDGPVSVYAHLRKDSIVVKEGDTINVGDLIGRCGNSGNSSQPHLHFHLQSELGFERGYGLRPIFDTLQVKLSLKEQNGSKKTGYTPRFPEFISLPK